MTTNNASILLFESDPLLCDLIQLSLEQEGFTVYVQRAAQNPLEIVKQIQPDIILLDLFYPQTQTIELIEKIHQLPNEPPIEIIVISALGFREVVQKLLMQEQGIYPQTARYIFCY
jgi:CheY-like chemotaxis protein